MTLSRIIAWNIGLLTVSCSSLFSYKISDITQNIWKSHTFDPSKTKDTIMRSFHWICRFEYDNIPRFSMLRLLVPLKFKKIWFIYDLSLSHLLLMAKAYCFLAPKTYIIYLYLRCNVHSRKQRIMVFKGEELLLTRFFGEISLTDCWYSHLFHQAFIDIRAHAYMLQASQFSIPCSGELGLRMCLAKTIHCCFQPSVPPPLFTMALFFSLNAI